MLSLFFAKNWKGLSIGTGVSLLLMLIPVSILYSSNLVKSGMLERERSKNIALATEKTAISMDLDRCDKNLIDSDNALRVQNSAVAMWMEKQKETSRRLTEQLIIAQRQDIEARERYRIKSEEADAAIQKAETTDDAVNALASAIFGEDDVR